MKLGLSPLRSEMDALVQLLRDREQDHRDWLKELEACVRERRVFQLARDPHRCKFGPWYDAYRGRDRLLQMTLPSMDAPHQAIHATADEVLRLFEESRRTLTERSREIAIVLSRGDRYVAFCAGRVEAAEHIPAANIEALPPQLADLSRAGMRIARRDRTGAPHVVVDGEYFFGEAA